jgi:hypothetical protein
MTPDLILTRLSQLPQSLLAMGTHSAGTFVNYVKVKVALEQAIKAQKENIVLIFL